MSARSGSIVAAVVVAIASQAGSVRAASTARTASAAPSIQIMVAGRSAVLFAPAPLRVGAATIRVGGRSCRVDAGTPLAALAAARRVHGPAFYVRDYARCSASARDAAGLFVYRIGRDVNRGQDGWVYKVDHRVGTTGAADELGPLGDGHRLRSGQRLVWFYCHMVASGCQRSLDVTAAQAAVAPGAALPVTVTAYDDRGHATPAAGSSVALGTATSTTGPDGRATLIAPSTPGTLALTASAPGLVPAFPLEERVG
jgi:hypothetical protein